MVAGFPPVEYAWLDVLMHSPSTGDLRSAHVGAPYDGTVSDWHVNGQTNQYPALPDFRIDLPEALSLSRGWARKAN